MKLNSVAFSHYFRYTNNKGMFLEQTIVKIFGNTVISINYISKFQLFDLIPNLTRSYNSLKEERWEL